MLGHRRLSQEQQEAVKQLAMVRLGQQVAD